MGLRHRDLRNVIIKLNFLVTWDNNALIFHFIEIIDRGSHDADGHCRRLRQLSRFYFFNRQFDYISIRLQSLFHLKNAC